MLPRLPAARPARRSLFALALLLGLAPGAARAGQTGGLRVAVRLAGAPVAGVPVTVSGPAELAARTQTTDASGEARFGALAAGVYTVRVSGAEAGAALLEGVAVDLDRTSRVVLDLPRPGVEDVVVRATRAAVDAAGTTTGLALRPATFEALPLGRSYIERLSLVPGVSQSTRPTAHGGVITANQYLVDGVSTSDPVGGVLAIDVNPDGIAEHEVITGGLPAEYGNAFGLLSNIVTRSGGNDWTGRVSLYRRDAGWTAQPDATDAPSNVITSLDGSATLGGPLVRDRLWHFVAVQGVRSENRPAEAFDTPDRPPRTTVDERYFGKLSWQVAPAHRVDLLGQYGTTDLTNNNAFDLALTEDQFNRQVEPKSFVAARYTGVLTPAVVLEGHVAAVSVERTIEPRHPELGPNHSAAGTTTQYGRYLAESYSSGDRLQARLDASWLPAVPGPGRHAFKFGVEAARTRSHDYAISSGGESYADRTAGGASLWSIFRPSNNLLARWRGLSANNGWGCTLGGVDCAQQTAAPSTFTDPAAWVMTIDGVDYDPRAFTFGRASLDGDAAAAGWVRYEGTRNTRAGAVEDVGQDLVALYAQDEWRAGRLTVRGGLRAERQSLRDSDGATIFRFDWTLAPRLGVAYDVRGDGRQRLLASAARIYQPVRDNTSGYVGQYHAPLTESRLWAEPVGAYATWSATGGALQPVGVLAPNLETPSSDEFLLGYAAELWRGGSVEVTAIRQETRNVVEDFDPLTGLGDPETYPTLQGNPTLAGLGFTDQDGDGSVTAEDLPAPFVVLNLPGSERTYVGLDLALQQDFGARGLARFSYSYAEHTGTLTNDAVFQRSIGNEPYWDPRLAHNDGKLAFLPVHTLRLFGSYRFDFGLTVGAVVRLNSGLRYSLTNILPPSGGSQRGIYDGDPAKAVDTLRIDRAAFSAELGIPATLPDGSRNPALDAAIVDLVPFELRAGRGAYEGSWLYTVDLRLAYAPRLFRDLGTELFVDVFNLTGVQHQNDYNTRLATDAPVTVANIGDRGNYVFGRPVSYQAPRSLAAGLRLSF